MTICDVKDQLRNEAVRKTKEDGSVAEYYHKDITEYELKQSFSKISADLESTYWFVDTTGMDSVDRLTHELEKDE